MNSITGYICEGGEHIIIKQLESPQEALSALSIGFKILYKNSILDSKIISSHEIINMIHFVEYDRGEVICVATPDVYMDNRIISVNKDDKNYNKAKKEFLDVLLDLYFQFKREDSKKFIKSCLDIIIKE